MRPWKAPSNVMMRKRSGWPFAAWIFARDLDRAFHRLGAGIAEEDGVGKGCRDQPLRQTLLTGECGTGSSVCHSFVGLLGHGLDQMRVGVAQGGDGDAAGEVEEIVARRPHTDTPPRPARRRRRHGRRSASRARWARLGRRRSRSAYSPGQVDYSPILAPSGAENRGKTGSILRGLALVNQAGPAGRLVPGHCRSTTLPGLNYRPSSLFRGGWRPLIARIRGCATGPGRTTRRPPCRDGVLDDCLSGQPLRIRSIPAARA